MGAIYRAIQEPLGRQVAVKILVAGDGGLDVRGIDRERFFREASIASRLSHPNTVVIHDYGALESRPGYYLVMEYLDGQTLADAIGDGPMELSRVIDIATQVCGALSEAHASDVVHRDLKPQNIMLVERADKRDFVKVVDFGLVKMVHPGQRSGEETAEGIIIGSPVYMAPEQIYAEAVDQRTDIYSLGVVLYEALCGRPPFIKQSSGGLQAIIMGHTSLTPPPFKVACPGSTIDPHIEALIQKCLAKNPEDRVATARDLAEQLAASTAISETGRRRATANFIVSAREQMATAAAATEGTGGAGNFEETADFAREDLLGAGSPSLSGASSAGSSRPDPALSAAATATSPLESKDVLPLGRSLDESSPTTSDGVQLVWVMIPLFVIALIGVLAWAPWKTSPAVAPATISKPAAQKSASAPSLDVTASPTPDAAKAPESAAAAPSDAAKKRAVATVSVTVECSPTAMLTDFMNTNLGETPRTLELKRSELPVTLKCVRPGYKTAERRITAQLVADSPSLKVTLVLVAETVPTPTPETSVQPEASPAVSTPAAKKKKKRRSGGSPGIKMNR